MTGEDVGADAPVVGDGQDRTAEEAHEQAVATLETQVGLLVRRARAFSTSVATEVHPDLDHSAYGIMLRLASVGAERTTDLAAFLGIGKPTTSRQLSQLVDLGLVERTSDPTDGRASLVRLTPEGTRRFGRVQEDRRTTLRRLLGPWADDDVLTLARLLERFNDLWAARPDPQQPDSQQPDPQQPDPQQPDPQQPDPQQPDPQQPDPQQPDPQQPDPQQPEPQQPS